MTDSPLIPAPFFSAIADGPNNGSAYWMRSGNLRIRAAVWPEGALGTVLLFPGRTEYAEKYGRAAGDLGARGYATLAIDWRGQGLADRALPDRMLGHVSDFTAYQTDVASVLRLIGQLDLPRPAYLLAHSMGGCIGLRALLRGMPVRAAVFSAPMWGIAMPAWKRPLAQSVARLAQLTGQTQRYVPGTSGRTYVAETAFDANVLTTDIDMWMYMQRQITQHPELALAGPSLGWLRQALGECAALARLPAPDMPCVTWLGGAERVVDAKSIHRRMANWRLGQTRMMPGAAHEIMMETPARRAAFFDSAAVLFRANA